MYQQPLFNDNGQALRDILPYTSPNGSGVDVGSTEKPFRNVYSDTVTADTISGDFVAGSAATGLTATGTNLATALQLTASVNNVTTVASGTAVKVSPDAPVGAPVQVRNGGVNALLLFPPTGSGVINGGTPGASVSITVGAIATITRVDTTNYIASEAPAA